jgi:tetratricopeptide (TPR) repeat protein
MKPFLCTGKLLSSDFRSILIDPLSLNNLANALLTRFEQRGQQSDLDEAMSSYLTATQYQFQSPSQVVFQIAKGWIRSADKNQHRSAIDAYEAALQALPQVAALSLDVQSRQEALAAGSDGLARDASRCAIRFGNLEKAIEFLEAGRSIFWTQVLSLRSPFINYKDIDQNWQIKYENYCNCTGNWVSS